MISADLSLVPGRAEVHNGLGFNTIDTIVWSYLHGSSPVGVLGRSTPWSAPIYFGTDRRKSGPIPLRSTAASASGWLRSGRVGIRAYSYPTSLQEALHGCFVRFLTLGLVDAQLPLCEDVSGLLSGLGELEDAHFAELHAGAVGAIKSGCRSSTRCRSERRSP
jgi:hypothetical protein